MPELSKYSQQTQDRAKTRSPSSLLIPRGCKPSQQNFPNFQSTPLLEEMNTRPVQNKIPQKHGYSVISALLHVPSTKPNKAEAWCRVYSPCFPSPCLNDMSFNIRFCFHNDTMNLQRKWIEVVEWSPQSCHGHLKMHYFMTQKYVLAMSVTKMATCRLALNLDLAAFLGSFQDVFDHHSFQIFYISHTVNHTEPTHQWQLIMVAPLEYLQFITSMGLSHMPARPVRQTQHLCSTNPLLHKLGGHFENAVPSSWTPQLPSLYTSAYQTSKCTVLLEKLRWDYFYL